MKIFSLFIILCCMALVHSPAIQAQNSLIHQNFSFEAKDSVFKNPFVDVDEWRDKPVKHRYVHGGFDDGTRFSFYFPEKENYTGRFFQYITPFPDSETSVQAYGEALNPIGFSITHGAYFVATNQGGKLDFADPSTRREASIGAYRANAVCAEFSRHIAQLIYNCERPFGYCYGGSGGAYRTVGSMENTSGIWDGAVPFVLGSPQAIPNVFAVRMYALRILKDKMADIVDALRPGGSGDPYATLTVEQRQVLHECTSMGFPIKSWYGWQTMDAHGFLVLYKSIVAMDPKYFRDDFWNTPGYLGFDNPASLQNDRVQTKGIIKRIIGQSEAEELNLVKPLSESDRGTADRAWASMGSEIKEKPVAYQLDVDVKEIGMGGDLIILTGKGKEQVLQITETLGRYVVLAPVNAPQQLALLTAGDSVQVDNSDFLAVQTYYRHQVPSPDYYVWNQFRGVNDVPIYPQRPMLLGPLITMGAAGTIPNGKINGKIILCCSVWDREAFAWQGDWYRNKVKEHLGEATEDNFRLWYTDRATHGEVDNPCEVVSYQSTLYQALLDVSAWVEKGIEPPLNTNYKIEDGQVIISEVAKERGGIQPAVSIKANGKERADIKVGESVTLETVIEVPSNTGGIVSAEWNFEGGEEFIPVENIEKYYTSPDGKKVIIQASHTFQKEGTYFPTLRVASQRNGDSKAQYTRIPNLNRVRVVVE
ncbi:PKD domain-containing protein [uncultured Draconibacterium sp.]|uniref:PKD domain-containing protein n=1 Tax=uncultured Draconibacterium sp. TaxID=1573823 RepID=UPI003216716E